MTTKDAKVLKDESKVYTVCYGAQNQTTYKGGPLSLKGEPMSNETNTRTATPTASPLTAQGTQQPVMVKRIGKTTYRVKLHFSETSKETMTDKIKRLILNDCAKEFEQSEKIS